MRIAILFCLTLLPAEWTTACAQAVAHGFGETADENLVSGDFQKLVHQVVDIKTKRGFQTGLKVVEVTPGKLPGSLSLLRYLPRNSKRPGRMSAIQIEEIYFDESPLDVAYDRKSRCLVVDAEKRAARLAHREKVKANLAAKRHRLWTPLTQQQHDDFMQKHREFIEKVRRLMPFVRFRLVETKFFLFLTELPPNQVDGYIANLDSMYEMLCTAFGISPDKNIWCGKCVVVTFQSELNYKTFERAVMENINAAGTQGLCHQYSDGTVIFAGFQGNGGLGHVLVHETSHGFVHRYLSTTRVPSWLNEGIADWLAEAVVKSKRTLAKQRKSASQIKFSNGWGNLLTADQIDGNHYGAASALVEILRSLDKTGYQFKQYFDAIKEGEEPEQSLQNTFGIDYRQLQMLYVRRITKMGY